MAANTRKYLMFSLFTAFAAADEEEQRKKKKEMKISCVWNMPDLGKYLGTYRYEIPCSWI